MTTDYNETLNEIITKLTSDLTKGYRIDVAEIVSHLDLDMNNSKLAKWLDDNNVTTKAKFERALEKEAQKRLKAEKIKNQFGIDLPETVTAFVNSVADVRGADMRLDGIMVQNNEVIIEGMSVNFDDPALDPAVRRYAMIQNQDDPAVFKLARELRIANEELKLGFNALSITEVTEAWADRKINERRVKLYRDIIFNDSTRRDHKMKVEDMWKMMEEAYFPGTTHERGFISAVVKKFMHQVKRKGAGQEVERHLMPVITGPQGCGKTTFVRNLVSVMPDMLRPITFDHLNDGKTADIYSSPVLFLDEMAGADRADINTIKTRITETHVTLRMMKTNNASAICQKSTFIGTSNNPLGTVVFDSTGMRRFAEIFMDKPGDWKLAEKVDWLMLWQSIDEYADDPMDPFRAYLTNQQEANRDKTPVEIWAESAGRIFAKDAKKSSDLFASFKLFAEENFSKKFSADSRAFSRQLNQYVKEHPDAGWRLIVDRREGNRFQYIGEHI